MLADSPLMPVEPVVRAPEPRPFWATFAVVYFYILAALCFGVVLMQLAGVLFLALASMLQPRTNPNWLFAMLPSTFIMTLIPLGLGILIFGAVRQISRGVADGRRVMLKVMWTCALLNLLLLIFMGVISMLSIELSASCAVWIGGLIILYSGPVKRWTTGSAVRTTPSHPA